MDTLCTHRMDKKDVEGDVIYPDIMFCVDSFEEVGELKLLQRPYPYLCIIIIRVVYIMCNILHVQYLYIVCINMNVR